ncbi:MAG: glycoside hydrolase family 15 protein [Gammaproteobacteria bacterium]|nr:glycoside hydrolase family 15 protein [Gammaproteobacteria bacterium]
MASDTSSSEAKPGQVPWMGHSHDPEDTLRRLRQYDVEIERIILARQHPVTGLLPASTAVTAHGDYTDAWVRDNVYSILAVWGMALAYRRADVERARTYALEQSVVKLMRGLLFAMMRQAHKVERFKYSQDPLDALHAKYDTRTGGEVVGDAAWGHLQIDATSLFLLMLAQMTASGLRIIFNQDEVDFVQNLVYYIGRAYSTPDYGIWERGNKINCGIRELNASSIGMALAALEAMNSFDLYGGEGDERSTIHVLPDEIARTEITLKSLLPRESNSKEVDAALLSVVGFPAFAVRNMALLDETQQAVIDKLQGSYGCKRFLLDGHQTVLEDPSRLHYEPHELKRFEHIESEWPLFFTYLLLNHLFLGRQEQARFYREHLERLAIEQDGLRLLPELYFVPADRIEAERQHPGSQPRQANENLPLVWAQSLFILGKLIQDGLLHPADIDPLGRRLRLGRRYHCPVQVAVLAENVEVQERLGWSGIHAEILEQVTPLRVAHSSKLIDLFGMLGCNPKLALTGRPPRRMRILTTSRPYALDGQQVLFVPQQLDRQDFYLGRDNVYLAGKLRSEIGFVHRYWRQPGMPLVVLWITRDMLEAANSEVLLDLLRDVHAGEVDGYPVRSGRLLQLMQNTRPERISTRHNFSLAEDGLPRVVERVPLLPTEGGEPHPLSDAEYQSLTLEAPSERLFAILANCSNPYAQIELLVALHARHGGDYVTPLRHPELGYELTLREITEYVFERAGCLTLWGVLRRAADLLDKVDAQLEVAVMDILVRQKQLAVGRSYSRRAIIREPLGNTEILAMIRAFCGQDERERILTQELIIHLGHIAKNESQLIRDILTLRVGHLLQLLIAGLARERGLSLDAAFDALLEKPPHRLLARLRETLLHFGDEQRGLGRTESLHIVGAPKEVVPVRFDAGPDVTQAVEDWLHWRQVQGAIGRLPDRFYPQVWGLLRHCRGLVIGDRYNRKNRLDSEQLLSESTAGEMNFALRVEHLLNKIAAPEYRQLVIEGLEALIAIMQANPDLRFEDDLVMDVLIGHAVRLAWLEEHPGDEGRYDEVRDLAWEAFYRRPPSDVSVFVTHALEFLVAEGSAASLILTE